jgi:hypothetical protein
VVRAPVTAPSRPDTTTYGPSKQMGLQILTIASYATLVIAYLWFIDAYAVNTIFVDQWSDLGLIDHAYSGHLTLSVLWTQHTDNRILFPNLVVLLLAKTTHFNVIDEEFISAFTLMAATALLIIGHRRRSPRTPWILYLPVAILMLSLVQNGNALWGFQFAWYLVLLALSVALVLCDDARWSWLVTAGAIVAAVVGSYSSLQGLLIWPTCLVVLLLRRRRPRFVISWIVAGVATTAIYFVNFNRQLGGSNDYAFHHPAQGLRFFFFSVGDVIGAHGGDLAVALGVLIVFTALWLTFSAVVRTEENDGSPLGVGLICFGLLFAVTITAGRAGPGLDAGGGSRYTTFDLLTLVGCYFVLLARRGAASADRRRDKVLWWASLGSVGVGVCLTLFLGTINGLDDASSWQSAQIQTARIIANMQKAPDSMIERDLIGNDPYLVPYTRQLVAFARQNHLSLFANPATVDGYLRAGLPYDANSLVTTVLSPRDDANEKGVVAFIASAQSDFGVANVEFEIMGRMGSRVTVSARDSRYGWIAVWDSLGLPDGRYRIQSIAYDHGSHRAQSEAVVVRVNN